MLVARHMAAGTEHGARDLLERRQRRVELERPRERRGARLADLGGPQPAARRGEERRVRDTRGEIGPLVQSRARATYESDVSVALILSASESAAVPASPICPTTLQRGEEGQGCSWRDRNAGKEQDARLDLRELRQRRVVLERPRERHGARLADGSLEASARRGGSEMLVARQGHRQKAGQGARDLLELR